MRQLALMDERVSLAAVEAGMAPVEGHALRIQWEVFGEWQTFLHQGGSKAIEVSHVGSGEPS